MDTLPSPPQHLYQDAPSWMIVLALAGAVLVALELGYRASRSWPERGNLTALQAAVFGLTTLLMAFSFSAAQVRFDERRVLAVREANAIGTLYLRAGYLPPPAREEIRRLLGQYLELHIRIVEPELPRARLEALKEENGQLQNRLWAVVERRSNELPNAVLLLTTSALNDVIDISSERWVAAMARLPSLVLLMLFTVVLASALLVSYHPERPHRDFAQWAVFLVTMVMVMLTLLDLDRPPRGFIRTSQLPLIELQASLRQAPP